MNKSITQDNQNDNQISKSIRRFFTRFHLSFALKNAIIPLDSDDRVNVLIIDDSMYERNRSKKVELLAKAYDHAKHCYKFGFRMLTLGWSDVSMFLPVNSILLSTENKKNRVNEAAEIDKRTVGYKRRMLAVKKRIDCHARSIEIR